ncbi:GTP cyclohydrolase I [Ilumatobacter fluminis]|uniref:GTP cyclohydrolase FolE2 n=1 Tax=Ilumatobacter fluminis TaxID=467091 RepID=A0A4R7HUE5_9ACTN|nr:GTP cyclohydrolase FolE2 [Ilumatobacter fluminis]TDT14587.1 GTP cyclohydrolase I [Ilumatobacter fluminis]
MNVSLEDVQGRPDERAICLQRAGVEALRYPVDVADTTGDAQSSVANFDLSVELPGHIKGTHMSRFVEAVAALSDPLSPTSIGGLAEDVRARLKAESATIRTSFPLFLDRAAPATGATAKLEYSCALTAVAASSARRTVVSVRVPVTSLCPCSKAISDYGAHNQRGQVTIAVDIGDSSSVGLIDLIGIAEACASSPVYPLVKRPDERVMTMTAYDKPVFVEDMVRDSVAMVAGKWPGLEFSVLAQNEESIHHHAAFAETWSPGFDHRLAPTHRD